MVVSRAGNKSADRQALKELEALAEKGISEDELQEVVADYEEEQIKQASAEDSFEVKKEKYKAERAREAFSSGNGGFKRSS